MNARIIARLNKPWERWPGWARQLSVALVYSVAYLYTWQLSFYHWFLLAGVRLLAVLVVPYRYWITLLVCDSLSAIPAIIDCEYTFGMIWKGLMLVPQDLFIMPLVAWGRLKRWLPYPLRLENSSTIIVLIVLMGAAALLIPLWTYFIDHFHRFISSGPSSEEWLQRNILGSYLGMLTLVPIGLFMAELLASRSSLKAALAQHRQWLVEIVSNLVVVAGLCLAIRLINNQEWDFLLRLGLLVPIIRAGFYYGWAGTALAGCLSSLAWASLEPAVYDPSTVHVEMLIGFAITSFLALGARLSSLDGAARYEKAENRRNLEAGRQLQGYAERRFQRIGGWLDRIAGPALTPSPALRPYLDHVLPPLESLALQNQGMSGQLQFRQLGTDLAPPLLRLDEQDADPFQALADLFQKEGVRLQGHLHDSMRRLAMPPFVQQAIGRLLLDACAYLVSQPAMYIQLDVSVRGIERRGVRAVAIRVRASRQPMIYDPAQREAQLERMLRLSSTGLELQGMAHLAKLCHGRLRHRTLNAGRAQSLQLLLRQDPEPIAARLASDSELD